MKCTIQSIADELELSRNTVARVLSGKDGVSAKTRKLVLKKAEEMSYGIAAPPLPKAQLPQLPESVVFLTDLSAGSPEARTAVIQAAEAYVKKQNYTLILAVLEKDSEQDGASALPAVLFSPAVRGILMMDIVDESIYQKIARLNLPTAVILPSEDTEQQSRNLHSYESRFDILYADSNRYQKQLMNVLTADLTSSVYFVSKDSNCSQLLQQTSFPDFFLCEDDWTAIRLIHAAQASGYSVPEHFSVIGCGNTPESSHVFPSLTTIEIPWKQIGCTAARCVTDRINQPELSCMSVSFSSKLIERQSTAGQSQIDIL